MRAATTIEGSGSADWNQTVDYVREAEKAGLDVCWVAEAWGSDAPSVLGYLAAKTEPMVRDRLRVWHAAGVDTVRMYPAGETLEQRLNNLTRGIDIIHSL
jgi:hypothetical protein